MVSFDLGSGYGFQTRILWLVVVTVLIAGVFLHVQSVNDSIASPHRRPSSQQMKTFADCQSISYVDARGTAIRAKLYGKDADGDGMAAKPSATGGPLMAVEYICGFATGIPRGYAEIETEFDIGADDDDTVRGKKW